jgi:hypothetical protein
LADSGEGGDGGKRLAGFQGGDIECCGVRAPGTAIQLSEKVVGEISGTDPITFQRARRL